MKLKSKAQEALFLFFPQDRVSFGIICNNVNEMIKSEFSRKLKEVSCHLQQTEPFTPWSNATEREIKGQKKGSISKTIRLKTPKRLCDDCLELSHTSNQILHM